MRQLLKHRPLLGWLFGQAEGEARKLKSVYGIRIDRREGKVYIHGDPELEVDIKGRDVYVSNKEGPFGPLDSAFLVEDDAVEYDLSLEAYEGEVEEYPGEIVINMRVKE
ncbi:MAG: hypothetical protein QW356_04675 [Candidatus Hadarchaeales archaeon]